MNDLDRTYDLLGGRVNLFFKDPHGRGVAGAQVTNRAAFHRLVSRQNESWNAYICLNPCVEGCIKKPSKDDIADIRFLGIDIDPCQSVVQPEEAVSIVMNGIGFVFGFDENPTTVVDSGRGFWFWVPVHRVGASINHCDRVFKDLTRALADRIEHRLEATGFRIDTTAAEVSRVVRCPGTINHRTGRTAKFHNSYDAQHHALGLCLDNFAAELEDPEPPRPLHNVSMRFIAPALHPLNLSTLIAGVNTGHASRHTRIFGLAKNFQEIGLTATLASGMLFEAGRRCTPPLPTSEILPIIQQVWGPL